MPNTSRFCLMAVLAMTELWAQSGSSVRIGPAVVMGDMNNYSAGLRFKRWRAGHLIAWDKFDAPGKVGVYNASLQLERMAVLQVDGAQSVSIVSADMTRHGEIVASGVATQQDGAKARFLAVISSSGSVTRMVRTEPYLAQYICAADDGSVWTVGEERSETGEVRQSGFAVLRQYSLEKGLLRGVASREQLHGERVSFGGPIHAAILQCDGSTVQFYSDVTHQWFEFDNRKGTLTEADIEPWPNDLTTATGIVVTGNGKVLASVRNLKSKEKSRMFELTPPGTDGMRHWIPVAGAECVVGGPCIFDVLAIEDGSLILMEGYDGTPKAIERLFQRTESRLPVSPQVPVRRRRTGRAWRGLPSA
jgi:hypothetical protein